MGLYKMACEKCSILEIIKYIEKDLQIDCRLTKVSDDVYNLFCLDQLINPETTIHKDMKTSRTTISVEKNIIRCWVEGCPLETKGPVSLLQFIYGISAIEASKLALDICGIQYDDSQNIMSPEQQITAVLNEYTDECHKNLLRGYELAENNTFNLDCFDSLYKSAAEYLISRKISKKTVKKFRYGVGGLRNPNNSSFLETRKKAKVLGKTGAEILKGRITIPNIERGNVLCITGRAINKEEERFWNVGNVTSLMNIDNAIKYNKIYAFEGAINMASYFELLGKSNCVSLKGSKTFKKDFLNRLTQYKSVINSNTEFIIVADPDVAGLNAAKAEGMELIKHGFIVSVIIMPEDSNDKKIDMNDIIKNNSKEQAKEIWDALDYDRKPFIMFMMEQEFSEIKNTNKFMESMLQAKIIEKYLKWDMSPMEKEILGRYLIKKGYYFRDDMWKYVNAKYKIDIKTNKETAAIFIESIEPSLKEMLDEYNENYALMTVELTDEIVDIPCKNAVILTSEYYILRAFKIAEKFKEKGIRIKFNYYEKEPESKIEFLSLCRNAKPVEIIKKEIKSKYFNE